MTNWPIALIALCTWLFMAFTFRYSSLSALTAAITMPVISFFMLPPVNTIFYSVIVILVVTKHHANIVRLIKGQESKISFKKK